MFHSRDFRFIEGLDNGMVRPSDSELSFSLQNEPI